MYTYNVKHAGSMLEETVVAGSVHYGTGSEWVKFYAEPTPSRDYNPVYAIRADVVASIDRVSDSTKPAALNAGNLIYEGDYNSQKVYYVNEVVRYGKGLYLALKTVPINTVSRNTTPTANNEYWGVVVYQGSAFPEHMVAIDEQYSEEEIRATLIEDSAGQLRMAADKTKLATDKVTDKAKIAAQTEEIRRLQAELLVVGTGSERIGKAGTRTFMGDYDPEHVYYKNNVVRYIETNNYIALKTVPRHTPPTDTAYWKHTRAEFS